MSLKPIIKFFFLFSLVKKISINNYISFIFLRDQYKANNIAILLHICNNIYIYFFNYNFPIITIEN